MNCEFCGALAMNGTRLQIVDGDYQEVPASVPRPTGDTACRECAIEKL